MEPLVDAGALDGFPGAPFDLAVVLAASDSVRHDCGWHIAPEVTETVELESDGPIVALRSLRVAGVEAVRDAQTNEVLTGWQLRRAGVLYRSGGWPRLVEVDLTHGYEVCPHALRPVIAERAAAIARGGYVRQESLAGRSVTLAATSEGRDPLAKFQLPPRP